MSAFDRTVSDQFITKTSRIAFVLLGVTGLVLKPHYSGPYEELVFAYGGNVAASFAVYFIIALLPLTGRFKILLTAVFALFVVELFEGTNGFGVMSNVYDRLDFAANVLGVGLALVADIATRPIINSRSKMGRAA
jgi:hypothetical protein